MKRKILAVAIIFFILIFIGSSYGDFGGHSHSSPSSHKRSHRSSHAGENYHGDSDDDYALPAALIITLFMCPFIYREDLSRGIKKLKSRFRKLKPMSEYYSFNPKFDENKIKKFISDLYFKMQETWQAKDISSIKDYMTDDFYYEMDKRLNKLRKRHLTDCTEKIKILEVTLKGWRQTYETDYIFVKLKTQIISYIFDDIFTKYIVSGDKDREILMEYEIELSRQSGTISNENFDWVISGMYGINKGYVGS